jgi:heptose I phosphotransferase
MTNLTIQPDWRAALEAAGLASFDALFAAGEAHKVDGHRYRSVSRLELPGPGGKPLVVYLKRQWGLEARASMRDFLGRRWPALPARREWKNTLRLLAAGIPVAPPVVWGLDHASSEPRSLIAFAEVHGPSLARYIAKTAPSALQGPAAARRHRIADLAGQAVRRLHDAGLSFPDLYGKHLYLEGPEAVEPRIVLIDVQRLRGRRPGHVAEDLAALFVSTECPSLTRTDRLRFLRAYMGRDYSAAAARTLGRRVEAVARTMPGRGKDPNLLTVIPGSTPQEPLIKIDGGRLRVVASVRPALEAAGLATLDALMAYRGGKQFRDKDGRTTVRLELPNPAGGTWALYLKRYTRVPWRLKLRRTFGLNPPASMAEAEARAIFRVAALGVPTMRRLAVGEELTRGGRAERSCLLTEEVPGVEADGYIERTFATDRSREAVAAKRRLIRSLARTARRFHADHLTHRDFYLCHFLVRPQPGGDPALHLIDLQRVLHHRNGMGRRWLIKDLGSLLFSSWPGPGTRINSPVLSRTDALRFAHEYFQTRRLTPDQKSLVRDVVAKARRIARREHRIRRRTRK